MLNSKWLWKTVSSETSPGESENSGSSRYSNEPEQEAVTESPNDSSQLPEVTSKETRTDEEVKECVKSLREKLSAALVMVSAKEDLVKQHSRVAEEAVAGWEKAENEAAELKQQLDVAVEQNLNLQVKTSHLDGALRECVRQLRQARDEQEKRISDAMVENSRRGELERRILDLQAEAEAARLEKSATNDPNTLLILEALEKENLFLKQEIDSRSKELEVMSIEWVLSTQAAEIASKLHLDSIKKVAKLEAECHRLQSIARKSSQLNIQKSFAAESLTGTTNHSEATNGSERGCSDSWATALISELNQFKKENPSTKSPTEIDMMDDFLEMERLAALPEMSNALFTAPESASGESISVANQLRPELDSIIQRVADLENLLEKTEAEKLELQNALDKTADYLKAAQSRMAEAEIGLQELQKELTVVNETKELLEFQLIAMETESRTMSANVDSLKTDIETERKLTAQLTAKCRELENELTRIIQETELQQNMNSNGELKVKQEDLAVAADKLAECQKTIESLGTQLKSLATLEDFLIDTSNIPGFSTDPSDSGTGAIWRLPSNNIPHGNEYSSQSSSFSPSSTNHVITAKSRNIFGNIFSRTKNVIEQENSRE